MGKVKTVKIDDSQITVGVDPRVNPSQEGQTHGSAPTNNQTPVEKIKKTKLSKRAAKKTQNAPKFRSKKYQAALEKVEKPKKYPLAEAVKLSQEVSFTKFPGTIEAHINTSAKNLRGLVSLPHFAGKSLRVLAFGPSTSSTTLTTSSLRVKESNDSKDFEGVMIGTEETIEDINTGSSTSSGLHFDVLVATPDWMPKLAKIAKILGPRGLMPNPKSGTVTTNLSKTIADLKGGKVEYKTEKDGQVIHLAVGKSTQVPEEVIANIKALYNILGRSKVQKITLSPTMGPGVKIDLSSI